MPRRCIVVINGKEKSIHESQSDLHSKYWFHNVVVWLGLKTVMYTIQGVSFAGLMVCRVCRVVSNHWTGPLYWATGLNFNLFSIHFQHCKLYIPFVQLIIFRLGKLIYIWYPLNQKSLKKPLSNKYLNPNSNKS